MQPWGRRRDIRSMGQHADWPNAGVRSQEQATQPSWPPDTPKREDRTGSYPGFNTPNNRKRLQSWDLQRLSQCQRCENGTEFRNRSAELGELRGLLGTKL